MAENDLNERQTTKINDEPAQISDEPAQISDEPAQINDEPAQINDEPTQISDKPTQISDKPTEKKTKSRIVKRVILIAAGAVPATAIFLATAFFSLYALVFIYYNCYNCIHTIPRTVVTDTGKIVYVYYQGLDRVKTETEYDKNDRMIKKTTYDDEGMLYSYSEYYYDENGVLTEEWVYRFGEFSSIKKYDADGNVVSESDTRPYE